MHLGKVMKYSVWSNNFLLNTSTLWYWFLYITARIIMLLNKTILTKVSNQYLMFLWMLKWQHLSKKEEKKIMSLIRKVKIWFEVYSSFSSTFCIPYWKWVELRKNDNFCRVLYFIKNAEPKKSSKLTTTTPNPTFTAHKPAHIKRPHN